MILKFKPYFKPVLWGGDRIAQFKRIHLYTDDQGEMGDIGESWEVSVIPGFESVVSEGPYKGLKLTQMCGLYGERLL